jgi:hypothetical protein
MFEGLTPSDDFGETGEFDPSFEHTVPSTEVPFRCGPLTGALTPENTSIRLFSQELGWYSRALVQLEDGSTVSLKLDDNLLEMLSGAGYRTERPPQPDDSDVAFFEEYVRVSTDEASTELENLL